MLLSNSKREERQQRAASDWWFGTVFIFHILLNNMECQHPNWLSLHHFSEGWLNHQPEKRWLGPSLGMPWSTWSLVGHLQDGVMYCDGTRIACRCFFQFSRNWMLFMFFSHCFPFVFLSLLLLAPTLVILSCASSCVFRGRHILCAGENIVNQNKRRLRATAATAGRSALIPSKDRKDLGWILDNWIFHNISFWWYNFHLIGIYQIKGGKSMCGLRNQWTSVCVWIGMYQYFGDPLAMSWVFVT